MRRAGREDEAPLSGGGVGVVAACTSVSFRYGRRRALDGVSLQIGSGVTGVLGPNGAGKSTLLGLLATLTVPVGGSVSLFGSDVRDRAARRAARRRIGVLPQRFSLVSSMTLGDTVAYAAWVNGVDSRDCAGAADRALELVGLLEDRGRRVGKLSGGQRQRVGIAAAMAHEPDLLILDEPSAGLDPLVRVQLRRALQQFGQDRAVVLSTHLVEDVLQICPSVLVLYEGRLVYDGPTQALADAELGEPTAGGLASPLERAYERLLAGTRPKPAS